jgi:hypothetical protein
MQKVVGSNPISRFSCGTGPGQDERNQESA